MLHQQEAQPRREQRQQGALLIAAGKGLHRGVRLADDVEMANAPGSPLLSRRPVNEEWAASLGQDEVLGEGEAADQPLLQPTGGHVGQASLQEAPVGCARQVPSI